MADYFKKYKSLYSSTSNSFNTGSTVTITPVSTAGLPTDTDVTMTFDRVDSAGTATPTKTERIVGTISGGNLVIKERGADGTTEQAHTSPVCEMVWNARDNNDIVDGILVEHQQTGRHKAITTSQITASNITACQVTCSNVAASGITGRLKFPFVYGIYDNGSSGSAIAINWLNGDRQKVTISASTTLSFTNAQSGQILTLVCQNATSGVYSTTLPSMKWTSSTATSLGTTSGCINTITVMYDGLASQYLAQAGVSYG